MKKTVTIGLLLLLCIGCDQGTKFTAKQLLEGGPTLSYIGDLFRLSFTENSGAFLGLGAGLPDNLRFAILVIPVLILLIGFLLFVMVNKKLDVPATLASTLIIGGGFSNLIDRIVHHGSVIDFMNIGVGPIRTGIFNVADLAIMAGGLMLAGHLVKASHKKANPDGF